MVRVCCSSHHVGDRVFGEKEPIEDRLETHGYCDDCFRLELADLEEGLKNERGGTVVLDARVIGAGDGVDRGRSFGI
jgi:hypothetical protein